MANNPERYLVGDDSRRPVHAAANGLCIVVSYDHVRLSTQKHDGYEKGRLLPGRLVFQVAGNWPISKLGELYGSKALCQSASRLSFEYRGRLVVASPRIPLSRSIPIMSGLIHPRYRLIPFCRVALSCCLLCGFGNFVRAGKKEKKEVTAPLQVTPENIKPWLRDVPLKIRRTGILPEEAETYYRVLAYARDVDSRDVKKAARAFLEQRWEHSKWHKRPRDKFPVYVDIYLHPESYQGRPVIMKGHVQRTVRGKASQNEFGIEEICEAWLYTEDSQSNPTVVVATGFPEGFPIGEKAIDHVTVTGYIYRMYTYNARDTRRFAPLLVAHEIRWTPPSESARNSSQIWGIIILLLGVTVSGSLLGILFLTIHRKKERSRKNVIEALEDFSSPDFETEDNRDA